MILFGSGCLAIIIAAVLGMGNALAIDPEDHVPAAAWLIPLVVGVLLLLAGARSVRSLKDGDAVSNTRPW
jgi:hypothetical protein